jgi:hypothetical protein
VLVAVGAGVLSPVLPGRTEAAVWISAGLAWAVQLVAFGAMLVARHQGRLFLLSWVGGMGLRMVVVGGVAWWGAQSGVFPLEPLLLSLVAFLFLLLLLEPIFLRLGLRTS